MDYSPLGSSVYGILQARILGWIAVTSFRPRDWTQVSHIAGRFFFTTWALRESLVLLWSVSWTFMRRCAPTQSLREKETYGEWTLSWSPVRGLGQSGGHTEIQQLLNDLEFALHSKFPKNILPFHHGFTYSTWSYVWRFLTWWTTDWNLLWFKYLNLVDVFPSLLFRVSVPDEFKSLVS